MAGRNPNQFEKRRREQEKQARQAAKRAERAARGESEDSDGVDEAGLMDKFRVLNERRAAGEVDDDTFEVERKAIFVALGLEEDDSDDE